MEELNDNQQIFITEYLANGLNGAKAYLTAYGDMDYNCACASASRLLSNVKIKEEIDKRINILLSDKTELTLKVLEEMKRLAFSNINEFLNYDSDSVNFKPSEEVDTRPIESVEINRIRSIKEGDEETGYVEKMKIKLYDKKSALDSLMKYLGMTKDAIPSSLNINLVYLDKQDADL